MIWGVLYMIIIYFSMFNRFIIASLVIFVNTNRALRRKVCIKKKNSVNILVNISQKLTKSFYE
ncbi:hypothetical protein COY54_01860, partial [Candidatus Falkowbacteria bacterium CG_4_10_14_0_8_um_filter_41_36]